MIFSASQLQQIKNFLFAEEPNIFTIEIKINGKTATYKSANWRFDLATIA